MPTISLTAPVSGTVITAGLHAANYGAIQTLLNGGLDASNLSSGKILGLSQLLQGTAVDGDGAAFDNAATIWKSTTDKKLRVGALVAGSDGQVLTSTGGVPTWGAATGAIAPTHLAGMGSGGSSLAVVANTAYLMPISNVTVTTTLTRLTWALLSVVAGNYDVGIYSSDDEATFTRLASKGSTAQPAAGNIITTIATATVTPVAGRRWYYGIALSTASSVEATNHSTIAAGGIPGYTKAASFPLPASLTAMTAVASAALPVIHGAV